MEHMSATDSHRRHVLFGPTRLRHGFFEWHFESMRSWRVEDRLADEGSLYHVATKIDQPMDLGIFPEFFNVRPPSYKLVYKPQ